MISRNNNHIVIIIIYGRAVGVTSGNSVAPTHKSFGRAAHALRGHTRITIIIIIIVFYIYICAYRIQYIVIFDASYVYVYHRYVRGRLIITVGACMARAPYELSRVK